MNASKMGLLAVMVGVAASAAPSLTVSARARALAIEAGDQHARLEVRDGGLHGDRTELEWNGATLRGRSLDQDIELTIEGDHIRGHIGPTTLSTLVTPDLTGFWLTGQLGDRRVELRFGPMEISGTVGPCTYTLSTDVDTYRGQRACGLPSVAPIDFALTLPRSLEGLSDPRSAALFLAVVVPFNITASVTPQADAADTVLRRFGLRLDDARPAEGPRGARITTVVAGSAAQRAGLQPGMVVTAAGAEDVESAAGLSAALLRLRPFDTLVLRLQRPDKSEWFQLAIGAPPLPAT
jgi:hypothetical protein